MISNNNQIDKLNYPSQNIARIKKKNLLLEVINHPISFQKITHPYQSQKITSNSQFRYGIFIVTAKLGDLNNKKFKVYLQNYLNSCNNLKLDGTIYLVKNYKNKLVAGVKFFGKKVIIKYPNINTNEYHNYAIKWTKNSISWYLDANVGVGGVLSGGLKIATIRSDVWINQVVRKENPLHLSLEIKANRHTKKFGQILVDKISIYQ